MKSVAESLRFGKDLLSLYGSHTGRWAIENASHNESRLDRAKTVVSTNQAIDTALDTILPLKVALDDIETSSPRQRLAPSAKHQHDLIDLIAYMPSAELTNITDASKEAVVLWRELGDGKLFSYIGIITNYAIDTYNNPDLSASRERFVKDSQSLMSQNRDFDKNVHGESSEKYRKLFKSLGVVLSPWLKKRVTMNGDKIPLSENIEEWIALEKFRGRSADEVAYPQFPEHKFGDSNQVLVVSDIDGYGNGRQKHAGKILSTNYRLIASDDELKIIQPDYFDNEKASDFSKEWWTDNLSEYPGMREGDGWHYFTNSLLEEFARKLNSGSWNLQDVYNYTEIIVDLPSKNTHMSNRMLRKFAESIALPMVEPQDDDLLSTRNDVLNVVLARLKSADNTGSYERWEAMSRMSEY